MKEIDKLKEFRNRSVEEIIKKHGDVLGCDLTEMKLSVIDAKEIIYRTFKEMAKEIIDEV